MNLRKIIFFSFILFLFCLITFTLVEMFVVSKARANPACTVSDDLTIASPFKLDMGCITVNGGCLSGGNNKACSANASDCSCDSGQDRALVICPAGKKVVGGGCSSDSGSVGLSHNNPSAGDQWFCDWAGGVGWEKAWAICCSTTMSVD